MPRVSRRAALIDLDGTLVDSAPELAVAADRMRVALGYDRAGVENVRLWVGNGINRLVAQALANACGEAPEAELLCRARAHFDTAYAEVLGTMAPLYPGVVEGLDCLRDAGVRTACITNKHRIFAVPLLGALGIADRFDVVVGGDSGVALKPDAAPLALAAGRLGVEVGDCVMIGDSATDVSAARAAGCPAWCVRSGYNRGEPLEACGPDRIFERFDEVARALVDGAEA